MNSNCMKRLNNNCNYYILVLKLQFRFISFTSKPINQNEGKNK